MKVAAVSALLLLLLAGTAAADIDARIEYGHGGRAVAGAITPLRLTLSSTEKLPVQVEMDARTAKRMISGELGFAHDQLRPGEKKTFTFLLRAGLSPHPTVDLHFDRSVVLHTPGGHTSAAASDHTIDLSLAEARHVVCPAAAPNLLVSGPGVQVLTRIFSGLFVFDVDSSNLPTVWDAYDGIDAVYLRSPGETAPLDPSQVRALLRFVRLGGRLIVSATRRPDLLKGTALGQVLPARIRSPKPRFDYLEVARALCQGPLDPRITALPHTFLTPLEPTDGRILLEAGDIPIAVEARRGLGEIVVLGFDPCRFAASGPELATAMTSLLCPALLRGKGGKDDDILPSGLSPDLSGGDPMTAVTGLLRTDAVTPPPIGLLSLFMVLYVLAVGPIDYFVLKRFRLLRYSALSFLLLAVVFSAAAWFFSFWLFGGSGLVNRVTLVDVVPSAGSSSADRIAIYDFEGVYAPRGGTVRLASSSRTAHFSDLTLSWTEMGGLGGTLPRAPIQLDMGDPAHPVGSISLPFRALRMVRGVFYRQETFPIDVEISKRGTVVVRNGLHFLLRDAVLAFPRGFVRIGDLAPGSEKTVQRLLQKYSKDIFRTGLGPNPIPSPGAIGELGHDHLEPEERKVAARAFMAYSLSSRLDKPSSREDWARQRLFEEIGLDRAGALRHGLAVLLAWTDERDPLRLPGGGEAGFSITVFRKYVKP